MKRCWISSAPVCGTRSAGPAPWCVFSFCEEDPAAYANAGYVLQKADLLLQSLGLGCGWFMDLKPAQPDPRFCIGLAFGHTDEPLRTEEAQFKRRPPGATPHAALALEHQRKRVVEALPKAENGKLEITIRYE